MSSLAVYRIMVLRERDADGKVVRTVYLHCPDLKSEEQLSLQILTHRYSGKHPLFSFPQPTPPEPCKYQGSDLSQIADETERAHAKIMIEESAREHMEYINRLREWEALQKCISEKDATLAHHLLRDRFGAYEITMVRDSYELPVNNFGF